VIVKLVPVKPTSHEAFRAALEKLTITAYDLSVEDSSKGAKIGTATGLLAVEDSLFDSQLEKSPTSLEKSILQDWSPPPLAPSLDRQIHSVGTAIILVSPPGGGSTLNLHLEIQRNDLIIVDSTVEYNVDVISMKLVSDQATYMKLPPSTYFALPLEDPNPAAIQLSSDGQPPDFDKLRTAINLALDRDPSTDQKFKLHLECRDDPFSPAESRQIASEITWNRALYPPPTPATNIYQMYTTPRVDSFNQPIS
jgi:hypothetical protein